MAATSGAIRLTHLYRGEKIWSLLVPVTKPEDYRRISPGGFGLPESVLV